MAKEQFLRNGRVKMLLSLIKEATRHFSLFKPADEATLYADNIQDSLIWELRMLGYNVRSNRTDNHSFTLTVSHQGDPRKDREAFKCQVLWGAPDVPPGRKAALRIQGPNEDITLFDEHMRDGSQADSLIAGNRIISAAASQIRNQFYRIVPKPLPIRKFGE